MSNPHMDLRGYEPGQFYDEMFVRKGEPRAGCEPLAQKIDALPEGELRPSGAPESTLQRVHVVGKLSAVSTEYVFRGRLTGTYQRDCDRCLAPASETVAQDVTWLFEPGEQEAPVASDADAPPAPSLASAPESTEAPPPKPVQRGHLRLVQ